MSLQDQMQVRHAFASSGCRVGGGARGGKGVWMMDVRKGEVRGEGRIPTGIPQIPRPFSPSTPFRSGRLGWSDPQTPRTPATVGCTNYLALSAMI